MNTFKYKVKVSANTSKEVANHRATTIKKRMRSRGYMVAMLWSEFYNEYLVLVRKPVQC